MKVRVKGREVVRANYNQIHQEYTATCPCVYADVGEVLYLHEYMFLCRTGRYRKRGRLRLYS